MFQKKNSTSVWLQAHEEAMPEEIKMVKTRIKVKLNLNSRNKGCIYAIHYNRLEDNSDCILRLFKVVIIKGLQTDQYTSTTEHTM